MDKKEIVVGKVAKEIFKHYTEVFGRFKNTPGFAVLVMKDQKPVLQAGFGQCTIDPANNARITPSTRFDIASASKQFVATLAAIYEQRKLLSVDDPVSAYLPGFPNHTDPAITISHLIHHESGLSEYSDEFLVRSEREPEVLFDLDMVLQFVKEKYDQEDHEPETPGTRFEYSNTGYCMLTLVLEKIGGDMIENLLDKEIFTPLEMNSTTADISVPRDIEHGFALGHNDFPDFEPIKYPSNLQLRAGDGSIFTTVEDLQKWFNSLHHGTLLPKQIIQDKLFGRHQLHYGYGFVVCNKLPHIFDGLESFGKKVKASDEKVPPVAVAHSGSWEGFMSELIHVMHPIQLSIAILANYSSDVCTRYAVDIIDRYTKEQ